MYIYVCVCIYINFRYKHIQLSLLQLLPIYFYLNVRSNIYDKSEINLARKTNLLTRIVHITFNKKPGILNTRNTHNRIALC